MITGHSNGWFRAVSMACLGMPLGSTTLLFSKLKNRKPWSGDSWGGDHPVSILSSRRTQMELISRKPARALLKGPRQTGKRLCLEVGKYVLDY